MKSICQHNNEPIKSLDREQAGSSKSEKCILQPDPMLFSYNLRESLRQHLLYIVEKNNQYVFIQIGTF